MATPNTRNATEGAAALEQSFPTTRRRPSPSEHARRVAWGHRQGAKNAAAYRALAQSKGEG